MAVVNSGSSLIRWIERRSFFGRPRYEKRQQTCQQAEQLADYVIRQSACRQSAAYTCVTPDFAVFWTGDACVCSTLAAYTSKFAACWADTPYSICYDLRYNNALFASWSSGHCTTTPPVEPSSSSIKVDPPSTPTPTTPTPIPAPPTPAPNTPTVPSPTPVPATPNVDTQPSPHREVPQSSEAPKITETPKQSPTTQEPKSEKPTETIPTSIPQPSFVSISVASSTSTASTGGLITVTPSHNALPKWTGTGSLLKGYCKTPEYIMIDGPTAYWAPVIGCVGGKPDCCPFDIAPSTIAVVAAALETGSASAGLVTAAAGSNRGFPSALSPGQSTLSICPDDYRSISDGCCPSNYFPWSTAFGGQTPCYSTLQAAMTPPPVSANLASDPSKPTSAIVNVVYAMQYSLQPASSKSGLATGVKIGVGVGAGVIAVVLGILTFLLIKKHKAHKRDKAALDEMSGLGSTRQSVATGSVAGGVRDWQKKLPSDISSGLEPVTEHPNTVAPQPQYPAEWRPGQRTVSPPLPHPGHYSRASLPSPPLPEGYSEVGGNMGYADGYRSELQSGSYVAHGQELQGGQGEWRHVGVAQQARYFEAPSGRMTPKMG